MKRKDRRDGAFRAGYDATNAMLQGLIDKWRALEPDGSDVQETLKGVHAALCGEVGRIEGILVAFGADRYVLGAVRAEVLEGAREATGAVAAVLADEEQAAPAGVRAKDRGKRPRRLPANVIPFPKGRR